jgi:hypothetical protein
MGRHRTGQGPELGDKTLRTQHPTAERLAKGEAGGARKPSSTNRWYADAGSVPPNSPIHPDRRASVATHGSARRGQKDDESDHDPAGPVHGSLEVEEEPASVVIIIDDVLACVPTRQDMVDDVFEFNAQATWHT